MLELCLQQCYAMTWKQHYDDDDAGNDTSASKQSHDAGNDSEVDVAATLSCWHWQ